MPPSDELPILAFKTAKSWETWLRKNHTKSTGIWLKIFKKASGIKTVTYAEALDAALCYGWIDSQKKSFDETAWLQRFGPRKPKSIWSKINVGHIDRLTKAGKMQAAGMAAVEQAKADGRWEKAYDSQSVMEIPADFLQALGKNKKAKAFFQTLNKSNLYSIGFRLQTAKKPETRLKRIRDIIEKLSKGKSMNSQD